MHLTPFFIIENKNNSYIDKVLIWGEIALGFVVSSWISRHALAHRCLILQPK